METPPNNNENNPATPPDGNGNNPTPPDDNGDNPTPPDDNGDNPTPPDGSDKQPPVGPIKTTELGIEGLKAARQKSGAEDSELPSLEDATSLMDEVLDDLDLDESTQQGPKPSDPTQSTGQALQVSHGNQTLSDEKANVSDTYMSRVETYALGVDAVRKHFGPEMADSVQKDLERIDAINPETIAELRYHEELDSATDKTARQLMFYGINADHLTPSEARKVVDFANDATPEIVEKKAETIYDAFLRHLNGGGTRRDGLEPAYYNEEEYRRKTDLQDKFKAYQDGELDLERGFDVEAVYSRLISEGYEESSYLKRHLEEDDLEDLEEEGLVEESELFVYGPFTEQDLADVEGDLSKSWTDITRPRYNGGAKYVGKRRRQIGAKRGIDQPSVTLHSGSSLAQLMGETIPANAHGIEQDLIHGFVASEILQDRRLNSKNTLVTTVSLAFEVLGLPKLDLPIKPKEPKELAEDVDEEAKKEYTEKLEEYEKKKREYDEEMEEIEPIKLEYDEARASVGWLAYYAAELLGYRHSEMTKRFGSQRPISEEFFREIAKTLSAMEDARFEFLDSHFGQTLTKMDEHMCDIIFNLSALSQLHTGNSGSSSSDSKESSELNKASSEDGQSSSGFKQTGDDYD